MEVHLRSQDAALLAGNGKEGRSDTSAAAPSTFNSTATQPLKRLRISSPVQNNLSSTLVLLMAELEFSGDSPRISSDSSELQTHNPSPCIALLGKSRSSNFSFFFAVSFDRARQD